MNSDFSEPPSDSICEQKKEVGPCKAACQDSTSTRTLKSVKNSFTEDAKQQQLPDLEDCEFPAKTKEFFLSSYKKMKYINGLSFPSEPPSDSICEQKKEVGPCKAAMPRFYFNKNTKKCERFIYGGCKGNSNNFRTLEDCEVACERRLSFPSEPLSNFICEQKKEVGPCKAAMPRFYFNRNTKKCERFIYGGCKGNSNNFRTLEDCEAACGREGFNTITFLFFTQGADSLRAMKTDFPSTLASSLHKFSMEVSFSFLIVSG
ncbi:kunitz-type serine protease inhibitor 6 [Trichonephila inaurata madagascariensis]|uniref:Kunitz-type serine protease inhibitor 6 n=1 Tax=Trichonephila inaurata madagascariensis TaxID=2747483 RepID=A0A8X6XEC4_9ARAC|nr:kunitz-type serine protease inhibitor 6 [Trichonephila inaurata madagascariensis]